MFNHMRKIALLGLIVILVSCGGEDKTPTNAEVSLQFTLGEGEEQKLPAGSGFDTDKQSLSFGNDNPINMEVGPIRLVLTNVTKEIITIDDESRGTNSSAYDIAGTCNKGMQIKPNDFCLLDVVFQPIIPNGTFRDTYKVSFAGKTAELSLTGRSLANTFVEIPDVATGLRVSDNYDNLKFNNISIGSTSASQTVEFQYFGKTPLVLNIGAPKISNSARNDIEIILTSDCNRTLRFSETCSAVINYRPSQVRKSTDANHATNNSSQLLISSSATAGDPEYIKALKTSYLPDESQFMGFTLKGTDTPGEVLIELGKDNFTVDGTKTYVDLGSISGPALLWLNAKDTVGDNSKVFYRFESTNPDFVINRNACDLALVNKASSCELEIVYVPTFKAVDTDNSTGYIIASAGNEKAFAKVTAQTADTTPFEVNKIDFSIESKNVQFPQTELGRAVTKEIIVSRTVGAAGNPVISSVSFESTSDYSYTSTCTANQILQDGEQCSLFVTFAPSGNAEVTGIVGTLNVITKPTLDGVETTTPLVFTGDSIKAGVAPLVDISTLTPINNLKITAELAPDPTATLRTHFFPNTGVRLASPSLIITLENTGAKTITGIGTVSTDLITFPINEDVIPSDEEVCGQSLPGNSTCKLPYTFKPRDTQTKSGYISIWGEDTDPSLTDNQFISLTGKGVNFNTYQSFGVVENGTINRLSIAYTNDTNIAVNITKMNLVQFTDNWAAVNDKGESLADNIGATTPSGSYAKVVADNYFTGANFNEPYNIPLNEQNFTIDQLACKGKIDPGASCLFELTLTTPTNSFEDDATKKRHDNGVYRTYIEVTDGNDNVLDRLHAFGSVIDKKVAYFRPYLATVVARNAYQNDDNISTMSWDAQVEVIGETMYTFGGEGSKTWWKGDKNLRRYDSARNAWVKLSKAVNNPFAAMTTQYGSQTSMTSYDGKLYIYGLKKIGDNEPTKLYIYDPNVGVEGTWSVSKDIIPQGFTPAINPIITGYQGKIYIFGGRNSGTGGMTGAFIVYDVNAETFSKPTIAIGGGTPSVNSATSPAMVVINEQDPADAKKSISVLYIHGGGNNTNKASASTDLWRLAMPIGGGWKWEKLQTSAVGNAITPELNLKRPSDRTKHKMLYYNGELLLTSAGIGSIGSPMTVLQNTYFVLSIDEGNITENCGSANLSDDCSNFSLFGATANSGGNAIDSGLPILQDNLSIHQPSILGEDLWFLNWNILGVYMDSRSE